MNIGIKVRLKVIKDIEIETDKRASKIVAALADECKRSIFKLISIQGEVYRAMNNASGRFKTFTTRSQPGQPPYRQTGALMASIETSSKGRRARVIGGNVGNILEAGSPTMRPRPFIARAVRNVRRQADTIVGRFK